MWSRAAVLALAACGSSPAGGSRTAVVVTYAGDRLEGGVTVIGHAPDGTLIDQVTADAVGRAEVGVDDDSLVTVVFGAPIDATPFFTIVTSTAPAEGSELGVHGPAHNTTPPLIVGVLQLDGAQLSGATYFDVTLGCATVRLTKLPAAIDIGACSLGTDANLDVLVRGYHDLGGDPPVPQLDGYAAGRVVLNDVAVLDLPAWQTTGPLVPVTLDGVAPYVNWTLHVDGLDFVSQSLVGNGQLFDNLAVDSVTIEAGIPAEGGARVTVREVADTPTAIALADADFLPALQPSFTQHAAPSFGASWPVSATGADAINLHASWTIGTIDTHRVVWEAVLPPDATGVTLPVFTGDLADYLPPISVVPIDVVLRHIDSSELADFAALTAAGIHAEERLQLNTIAPRPETGQVRTSHVIGM